MFLRDIDFGKSLYEILPLDQEREGVYTQAVVEMYLSSLPKKYVLDGCAKVNIELGSKADEKKYRNFDDVSIYYKEDFDFTRYFNLDAESRFFYLLDKLHAAMLEIAEMYQADTEPLEVAYNESRKTPIFKEIKLRISKQSPDRKYRLHVLRVVLIDHEKLVVRILRGRKEVISEILLEEHTDYLKTSYDCKKSEWKENVFIIRDFINRTKYKVDLSKYI